MQISHDTVFESYVQNPCRKYLLEKARLHNKTLCHCQGGVDADPPPDDTVKGVLMQIPHQMTKSMWCWCRSPTRWNCQGGVDADPHQMSLSRGCWCRSPIRCHCQGGVDADPPPDDTVKGVLMQIPHQMSLSRGVDADPHQMILSRGCWCRSPTRPNVRAMCRCHVAI